MTSTKIYVSASPGEVRIAEVQDGELTGLTIERLGQETRVGDIFLGRVDGVAHNLQAAFIDIGLERAAFLALPEVKPRDAGDDVQIGDYLREGESVLVQIQRDAEAGKGAKVTARPVLTGRDLVFTPLQAGVSISRRITEADDRDRLAAVMDGITADDGGYIVRTVAQDAEEEDLAAEAQRLRDRWQAVAASQSAASAPACLYREVPAACRAIREQGGIDLQSVLVDDPEEFKRITAFIETDMPDIADIVTLHQGNGSLFEGDGVEELIDAAVGAMVPLPNGGNIIISETPALTAVDVNTASASGGGREHLATEVNLEAAEEIARQIQLRNISGLVVVDFVSMRQRDNQEAVLNALKQALSADPQHPFVGGFTRFGLVELTRRRQGRSLGQIMSTDTCAAINSPETTALAALRAVLAEASAAPTAAMTLRVHPSVADVLNGDLRAALEDTRGRLGGGLDLTVDERINPEGFDVTADGGNR